MDWASKYEIKVSSYEDYVLYPILKGGNLSPKNQKPFTVFTPFKKHCMSKYVVERPNLFKFNSDHFETDEVL